MILADTCIWADYLGPGDPLMAEQLAKRAIVMHPYIIGEIALGTLRKRDAILRQLSTISRLPVAEPYEILVFIEREGLHGLGIGYVDAHLLASTLLRPRTLLWTRDKRLHAAAERLGIAARPVN